MSWWAQIALGIAAMLPILILVPGCYLYDKATKALRAARADPRKAPPTAS